MSKEKLSAKERLDYYLWAHHSVKLSKESIKEIISICTEQLKREKEEAINLLQRIYDIKSLWACKKGEPTPGIFEGEDLALLTMESEIKAILTPKPEK